MSVVVRITILHQGYYTYHTQNQVIRAIHSIRRETPSRIMQAVEKSSARWQPSHDQSPAGTAAKEGVMHGKCQATRHVSHHSKSYSYTVRWICREKELVSYLSNADVYSPVL